MATLKVSSTSEPKAAAGALANTIREQGWAEIQVIGPKAVNQAVKAIAIARGYIAPSGIDLVSIPSFTDVIINGEEKTAIRIVVKPRYPVSQFQQGQEAVGAGAEEVAEAVTVTEEAGAAEVAELAEPPGAAEATGQPAAEAEAGLEMESELESEGGGEGGLSAESGSGEEGQPGLNA